LFIPAVYRIEQKMNASTAENANGCFLDLNAFFASCEQQENPVLRGQPVIVVQTPADSAVAIAASYAAATRIAAPKPVICSRRSTAGSALDLVGRPRSLIYRASP
jgi:hypothetical protein